MTSNAKKPHGEPEPALCLLISTFDVTSCIHEVVPLLSFLGNNVYHNGQKTSQIPRVEPSIKNQFIKDSVCSGLFTIKIAQIKIAQVIVHAINALTHIFHS